MNANDIRKTFLDFYRERGHRVFPSASLVPSDPTLLLTVAGMVPFKPYFEGTKTMDPPRAASVQKCIRTNDIENVGVTARHQTLFEMLGNFSFGDYFKREAIEWAWELSIGPYGLEPDRIWVTVYERDDEAARIWREVVGLPEERIVRRGPEDNFWSIAGVRGPGGPNTELFYDRGAEPMRVFDDGDQLMEYYNLVFTEFDVGTDGEPVAELPNKNVDTGGGLERTAQILQGVPTAYDTDVFKPILERAQTITSRRYGSDPAVDVSLRILSEHARAAMFLIGDGVLPSNEGRGYVLRRLIRRAVRHAAILGVDDPVMPAMIDASIATMGDWYTDLPQNRSFIEQVASAEEDHFRGTMRAGQTILDLAIGEATQGGGRSLGGDVVFRLHDTHGFPKELTAEIAREAGLEIDEDTFERLMDEQRERARAGAKFGAGADARALQEVLAERGPSAFAGYERTELEAKVAGLVRGGERVEAAREGDEVEVVLDLTPFYPEGGGQIGDRGTIEVDGAVLEVSDTQRVFGDLIVHAARVRSGEVVAGSAAVARVDADARAATQRSHTATHVLHALLRRMVGEHARQAGSLVEPGRLRFDFPHFERVPREVLAQVEETVNAHLLADELVRAYETTMDEARERGAMMLFEEKYGDIVRVVEIGDYSVELCGGTHVTHTAQVGVVKILGEASIGSNLRRIEALTGAEAIADYRRSEALLQHIAALLKAEPETAAARVQKLLDDLRAHEASIRKTQEAGQRGRATELAKDAQRIGDTAFVAAQVEPLRVDELQKLAAAVREAAGAPAAVVLGAPVDGRAAVVAVVDKATAGRIDPKRLVEKAAELIGGRPGGKGPLATAVGPDGDQLPAALDAARAAAGDVLA